MDLDKSASIRVGMPHSLGRKRPVVTLANAGSGQLAAANVGLGTSSRLATCGRATR